MEKQSHKDLSKNDLLDTPAVPYTLKSLDTIEDNVYRVLGLQQIHYLADYIKVEPYNIPYIESTRYNVLLLKDDTKYLLKLIEIYEMCPSLWTTASYGKMKLIEFNKNIPLTHIPKKKINIILDVKTKKCDNEVFEFLKVGDKWYPSGYVKIHLDNFNRTSRAKYNRMVWIFTGKSESDKLYLGSKLKDLLIYKTNSHESLPNKIYADVIILGNKFNYNYEDIKPFGEVEIVRCDFIPILTPSIKQENSKTVWIFRGSSGLGKSYLSSLLEGLSVYETDSSKELPDEIHERVIVIGNKYNHKYENIISRIVNNTKSVECMFSQ